MSPQEVFSHPFSYANEADARLFQNVDLNLLWVSSDFHDLDLNKSLEVGSYPILRARRTTSSSSGECIWKNVWQLLC